MPDPHEVQPRVLLLASRYDLTCDFIVTKLISKSIAYLRLNSEDLNDTEIDMDPVEQRLSVKQGSCAYCITPEHLDSVLFRRPVYLRDYGDDSRTAEERFSRLQWSAFMRNLMLFDNALWVNDPAATYKAEHKAIQLSVAARLGFLVPETRVTNKPQIGLLNAGCSRIAVKGLDTVLLRSNGLEMFGFTTLENPYDLQPDDWSTAPATIQAALIDKVDIRSTVVGSRVYSASITSKNGRPLRGDWRCHKDDVQFTAIELPKQINQLCIELTRTLGLHFGGIDLALCGGEYYFIEINPTGEWAWLVDAAGLPIDEAIADLLIQKGASSVT